MSKRNNLLLLKDIVEAINNIDEYLTDFTEDDFYRGRKTKDAVVRNLEIIGEASNQVTNEFKMLHTNIEWRETADLRNKIIHDYSGVDYVLLWEIIKLDIPDFKQKILNLIEQLEQLSK